MDINKLYQQTILEYSNRKDLKKEIDNPTDIQRGHNPSCGDDLTLVVKIKDELIEELSSLEEDMLEEAKLLEITKDMPARIKCSTLSWHSLKIIIDKY